MQAAPEAALPQLGAVELQHQRNVQQSGQQRAAAIEGGVPLVDGLWPNATCRAQRRGAERDVVRQVLDFAFRPVKPGFGSDDRRRGGDTRQAIRRDHVHVYADLLETTDDPGGVGDRAATFEAQPQLATQIQDAAWAVQ